MDPNIPMNKLFVFKASPSFKLKSLERDAKGSISFRPLTFYMDECTIQ